MVESLTVAARAAAQQWCKRDNIQVVKETAVILEVAAEMGIADLVSIEDGCIVVAYREEVARRPVPVRINKERAFELLAEMVRFVRIQ
jgi:hypothetical protein